MSYEFLGYSRRHYSSDSSPASSYRRLPLFHHQKACYGKKARIISTVYTITTYALVAIISNQQAGFACIAYLLFWLPNCRTLAGRNQNILSKSAEKYMKNAVWRARISAVIYVFFLAVLWLVSVKSTAHLLLRLTFPFAVLLFFLFKYRQIEDDVEAGRKWQGKLDSEQFEKDKDGR